ncbi:MAG: TetR/AcrR family transcriptional regulator [Oceanicaulis sp.]|nr:TetR/AcrR family transcriptional regulator [Oceanicaulis sp.]
MSDAKTKIMQAASKLFLQAGSKGLSVRAIAREAGVSTIGIYSHFDGKQGILDALYIEGFQQVEATTALPEGAMERDAIETVVRQYLRSVQAHEAHYRLIFGEQAPDFTPSDAARQAAGRAFASLLNVAADFLPDHTPPQTRDAALQIWALIHGFVSLRHHVAMLKQDDEAWEDQVVRAVIVHIKALDEPES